MNTSPRRYVFGLVTLRQMIGALVAAIENPPDGVRTVEVPQIRRTAIRGT